VIRLQGLTRRFPGGRGIFDLSFDVPEGTVLGFLGPNGAGKSTTIRHLMGFLKPDAGRAEINGRDCWTDAAVIHADVGYLPGEIGFPEDMTGGQFLDLMRGMRGTAPDRDRRQELVERFELDLRQSIRKMSKGTKQKVGLVAAFMHAPMVLILDEPTSGLDPLMQERFLDLIAAERERGATVLMSSHAFAEVERTADRVAIIKDGRLAALRNLTELGRLQRKVFTVTVACDADVASLEAQGWSVLARRGRELELEVGGDYNAFIQALSHVDVLKLDAKDQTLEDVFLHIYGAEKGVAQ
jgi:ABC-2 type transport system ATP-binding protein